MLIKCKECGKEISEEAQSCPNCGCPNIKEKNNLKKKRASQLSAWAILLCWFPYVSFVGFILALVDLIQNDKETSHGYSIAAIIISVLAVCIFTTNV